MPEVARQAEEAAKTLRDFDAIAAPGPGIEAIEKRLPDIDVRIAAQTEVTTRQLDGKPSGPTLDALTALWQTTRVELIGYVDLLTRKATDLEGALSRLTTMRDTWARTRMEARASRAPAQVIERIDAVVSAIDASAMRLQKQRTATLVLQDRVVQAFARSDSVQARIADARLGLGGRFLVPDTPPVWDVEQLHRGLDELPTRIRSTVDIDVAQLRPSARKQRWQIPLQMALFVGLLLLISAARRRARRWAAQGEPATGLRVFERPIAAAVVLTLLASGWVYSPPPPRAATGLGQVLALALAVRVMRPLVDPPLVPGLYVLGGFFLTDLLRSYAAVIPLLEQLIFLIEMLAGIAALAWWLVSQRLRPPRAGDTVSRAYSALEIAAPLVLLAFVGAFVAGAAGYMSLALLLGSSVLGSGYLALVFYAGVRVGDALVAFILRVRPVRLLSMVERHRALLQRRAHGILRWLAIGGWLVLSLRYFGLWTWAVALVQKALDAELRRGFLRISLGDVLLFVLTVWAAFFSPHSSGSCWRKTCTPGSRLGRGLPQVLSSVLHYALLLTGFLLALAALGVDLTRSPSWRARSASASASGCRTWSTTSCRGSSFSSSAGSTWVTRSRSAMCRGGCSRWAFAPAPSARGRAPRSSSPTRS